MIDSGRFDKRKVLMVDYLLPDSIYVLELGKELKRYCDLTVFCRKDAGVSEEGIRWITRFYPGGRNKAGAVAEYGATLFELAKTIRKGSYDVVHIQTFKDIRYELPLYRRLRKYYKKLVLTVHNVLPHEAGERERERYKGLYDLCDELIVHNHTTERELTEQFHIPEEKITVTAHGAYQTHLRETTEMTGIRGGEKKRFLLFGFIRRYKGIDILLEAVSLIPAEKRKKLHFTIAGKQYEKLDGTDYQALIQKLGLEDCVSFTKGHVPDEKIPELFENTDFAVFPYRHIYGSGALLFAYTYGRPVIASDIPAFVEETENGSTGILFESENPQALADAILMAAECKTQQMEQYRRAIRRLTEDKYNWKISAAKTAEVYLK